MKKINKIVSEAINKIIKENNSQIEIYYHGGDIKHDIWYNHVLWLTPQDYYAKGYAKEQNEPVIWEVKIDESKLNATSVWGMDDLEGGNGSFDPYDPDLKTIKSAKEEGYNCYWMEYDWYNAEGLCLFNKKPIISVRKLSKEEYENIDDWED